MSIIRMFSMGSLLAVALAGCNPGTDVEIGSLKVSVTTEGSDPDPDGYTIRISGGDGQAIGINGELTISELVPGSYPVSLSGLAPQCFTGGSPTITVPVKAGVQAIAAFTVTCSATNPYVRITTQTTGPDPDPDGYLVKLGGAPARRVLTQGVINLSTLEEGQVDLALSDVAAHCTPDAGNPTAVSAVRGQPNPVTIKVACAPINGVIEVTVATSGEDVQPNGFAVTVEERKFNGFDETVVSTPVMLDATNKGAIRTAAGAHLVLLDTYSLQANCTVTSANPQTVNVTVGAVTPVTIAVACAPLASVTVSVTTTGPDPDTDGYSVVLNNGGWYGGTSYAFSVASNGPTSPTEGLLPDTYQVSVNGIAANCRLASATPNPLIVSVGSTTLTVAVECFAARQFAFVVGTGQTSEVWVGTGAGTAGRITTNAVADSNPAWSPDGTRLVFASARDGNSEIYSMNADGSDVRRLTTSAAPDYQPTWSPDGTRIAFVSQRDDVLGDVYVMGADGSNPVRITTDPRFDAEPAWSPNGSSILFVSQRSGSRAIHVMNPDGSGVVQLTSTSPSLPDANPAWSPSGARVAFSRGGQVHTMNANGSLVASTSAFMYGFSGISWGADDQIAFATQRCDAWYGCYYVTGFGIDVLQPDGSVVPLSFTGGSEPAWRP